MPELSGFELQVQLNGSAQPVPVVVITGHDTPEAEKRVMDAGAIAYLRKPIDDQELLEAVGKALAAV